MKNDSIETNKSFEIRRKGSWWVLFPIIGLAVVDREPRIEKPLWGDATLVSMAHLEALVQRPRLNPRAKRPQNYGRDILFLLGVTGDLPVKARWHSPEEIPASYLAIRRNLERDVNSTRNFIPRSAIERAACLEAALAFGMLDDRESRFHTCGFLRHGRAPMTPLAALEVEVGGFVAEFMGSFSLFQLTRPAISLDYASLVNRLAASRVSSAVRTLLAQPKKSDRPLAHNLRRACCRLASACFSGNAESMALGAVTALEMLLSPDGDFAALEARCAAIVADLPNAPHVLRLLLKARHDHVHRGYEVSENILSRALPVLLTIIERIARSQGVFSSQEQLCAYSDAITATQRLKSRFVQSSVGVPSLKSHPWVRPARSKGSGVLSPPARGK